MHKKYLFILNTLFTMFRLSFFLELKMLISLVKYRETEKENNYLNIDKEK